MKTFPAILNRVNKITFLIYSIFTILIVVLLQINVISYGIGITDSLMKIIFAVIAAVIFLFQAGAVKAKANVKNILLTANTIFMILMMLYYVLEDGFRIM